MRRREFLEGAGTALVTLPAWAAGCGAAQSDLIRPPPPAVPPAPGTSAPRAQPAVRPAYFERFGVDQALLARTIEKGLGRGGDYCEVFLQHRVNHWLGLEDGEVNRAYADVGLGAGIRVLKGDATGFAYTEDLGEAELSRAAQTAATVADGASAARPAPLAAAEVKSAYRVEVPWTEIGIDRKLPLVQETERLCRARDQRVVKTTIYLGDETTHILVASSAGLLVEDEQPMADLQALCVAASKGQTEMSGQSASARDGLGFFAPDLLRRVAHEAVDFTLLLFDAAPAPVGELPVVLATGITGILLHEAIGHGMEADFNRKGISIYSNRIGQRIAAEQVTIVDDGTNPRLRGSINVDDEGTPAERTVLVDKGILRSYLHDRISARHFGVASTGSGRRESYRFPPVPRMRNTYMLDGPHPPEEIIASVKRGLYAEKFWNGQVNIGGGDFTFYLKHGRLIEDGKLTRVVKDANLIGNGPKVLDRVDMVGNDMAFFSGGGACGKDGQRVPVGFGLPTVRAGAISIGGRAA
ncbi:MAG: TldD/PmbA family protein [Deltaproteobacteria bacterium]|nr:TldD/PmbA family protein [Deltaproteobacteria bacterium]